MNSELSRINQEKNWFIGIAAHDLRSPLAGIHALTEILLLEKERFSQDQVEMSQKIMRLSQHMLSLIKNLLDVSRIESGILTLELRAGNYLEFVQENVLEKAIQYLNEN